MVPRIALGLVHWPVFDKVGASVCTNVTNFDIHDIARACRTYGVEKYFVINRMREQLMFVERILDHWRTGDGAQYNPSRKQALECTQTAETLQEALKMWDAPQPIVIGTSAKTRGSKPPLEFKKLSEAWAAGTDPNSYFLVFGTGYGLGEEFDGLCDEWLEPMKPREDTNFLHLSVRSAVSICLDRLLGA